MRSTLRCTLPLALIVILSAGVAGFAQTVKLPAVVEVPPVRAPEEASAPPAEADADEQPPTDERASTGVPLPSPRPDAPKEAPDGKAEPQQAAARPDKPKTGLPREEALCRQRLREMGVTFTAHEPLSDPSGCEVPHPITVTGLPGGVALEPEAVLNCATAEATAHLIRDVVTPGAKAEFGSPLATLNHASAYVCRPRAGQGKLSEHAFGNALDWASLVLKDGTEIDVRGYGRTHERRSDFLSRIRDAACGPFKTVLGPGTNADHADHFHFDLAERRNGGTYCR